MASPITGTPYLGGALHEGDYVDLTAAEAAIWNVQYGNKLYPGRYRLVRVSVNATNTNFGFGYPVGYGLGTFVDNAIVAAAGSGYTITAGGASSGTVQSVPSAAGGTAAVVSLTLSGGALSAAQVTYAGASMTSVPTFHSVERSDRLASLGSACRGAVREPNLHQFFRLVLRRNLSECAASP